MVSHAHAVCMLFHKASEETQRPVTLTTWFMQAQEPGGLKDILKQLMDAMQDNMSLARLVRPVEAIISKHQAA